MKKLVLLMFVVAAALCSCQPNPEKEANDFLQKIIRIYEEACLEASKANSKEELREIDEKASFRINLEVNKIGKEKADSFEKLLSWENKQKLEKVTEKYRKARARLKQQ